MQPMDIQERDAECRRSLVFMVMGDVDSDEKAGTSNLKMAKVNCEHDMMC